MNHSSEQEPRSAILPTDPFEIALAGKLGLPDGAHTQPAVVQAVDFYGNATSFILQTVKWAEGTTVFLTQVNAQGSARFALPPKVVALLLRQQDAVTTIVRRRHGRRLAEERKANGNLAVGFTPEMRKKAAATRKANAARRAAKRAKKGRGAMSAPSFHHPFVQAVGRDWLMRCDHCGAETVWPTQTEANKAADLHERTAGPVELQKLLRYPAPLPRRRR